MSTPYEPTLVVDTREQMPLVFGAMRVVTGTLRSGDYSILGAEELFAVERKSIGDLVGSVTGGRDAFERELHRLRGFRFARLVVECRREDVEQQRYRSHANPKAVLNSLAAFEVRYGVPVIWSGDRETSASMIEGWARWFSREVIQDYSKLHQHKQPYLHLDSLIMRDIVNAAAGVGDGDTDVLARYSRLRVDAGLPSLPAIDPTPPHA